MNSPKCNLYLFDLIVSLTILVISFFLILGSSKIAIYFDFAILSHLVFMPPLLSEFVFEIPHLV